MMLHFNFQLLLSLAPYLDIKKRKKQKIRSINEDAEWLIRNINSVITESHRKKEKLINNFSHSIQICRSSSQTTIKSFTARGRQP